MTGAPGAQKIEGLDTLTKLRRLYLYSNKISKLENLDKLTSLEVLWVANNQIGNCDRCYHL